MARPKKSNRADGRYQIIRVIGYTAENKAIKKSFYGKSREDALKKYQEFLSDAERKEEAKKRTDFAEWVHEWLYTCKEPEVKPTTFLSTYLRPCKNHILPYFDGAILQDITFIKIKAFVNTLSHLSQSTIDKVIICLRGIFETAVDNDLIIKNPCRNITCKSKKEKEKKRVYDKESTERLCASDHKYALLVHILLRMGLRCSELCGLRWEDIDLDNGTLSVSQALTVEGGRVFIGKPKSQNSLRRLPIPHDLLERLRKERGNNTGYIAMLNGHHITPDHFTERQLEFFYNYEGVPKEQRLTAHELRHTCGTLLYDTTRDIYHVSRFLGHSDIGITTKTYVHSEMQDAKIHIIFS